MKYTLLWVVTRCNSETARCFGETSTSSSGSKSMPNQKPEGGGKLSPDIFLLGLFLYLEDGGCISPKCYSVSEQHGVTTQKTAVLMGTQVTWPGFLLDTPDFYSLSCMLQEVRDGRCEFLGFDTVYPDRFSMVLPKPSRQMSREYLKLFHHRFL